MAIEKLFDQNAHVDKFGGVLERGSAVAGDDNALAGSEAVGLDYVWCAEVIHGVFNFLKGVALTRHAGWHTGRRHNFFGKTLRAFKLRGLL